MNRKNYSASSVKYCFWFEPFQKEIELLAAGIRFDEIRELCRTENIFRAPSEARAVQIYNTVSDRVETLGYDYYRMFLDSDERTRKLFNLAAIMANNTLFFDFMYEMVREKMIDGVDAYGTADVNAFFLEKRRQGSRVAEWKEETCRRLGRNFNVYLFEAGMIDRVNGDKKIIRPVLGPDLSDLLLERDLEPIMEAIVGISSLDFGI